MVRQAANLGANYPQIVAILEKANKQRNLPGQLVVDAVPAASPAYLDAILGRDLHAKRDSDGQVGPPPRRTDRDGGGSCRLFNREQDTNPAPTSSATPTAAPTATSTRRPAAGTSPSDPDLPPLPGEPASAVAGTESTAPTPSAETVRATRSPPRRMMPCSRPRPARRPRPPTPLRPRPRPAAASSTSSGGTTTTDPPDPARGRFFLPSPGGGLPRRDRPRKESGSSAEPTPIDASLALSRDFIAATAPRIVLHGGASPGPS